MTWKEKLLKAKELLSSAVVENVYDACLLLKEVIDDPGFLDEANKQPDPGSFHRDEIDRVLGMVRLNATELLQLIRRRPNREAWKVGLDRLWAEVSQEIADEIRTNRVAGPKQVRMRATIEELKEKDRIIKTVLDEKTKLEKVAEERATAISELREQIRNRPEKPNGLVEKLKAENADLRERLAAVTAERDRYKRELERLRRRKPSRSKVLA